MPTSGWGKGEWGSSNWGSGQSASSGPTITPLDPIDGEAGVSRGTEVQIRFTDELQVTPSQTNVSVNGTIWVLGGVGINGAVVETTSNAEFGFDFVITPPAEYLPSSQQEVLVSSINTSGFLSSLIYYFYVGVGLRILKVINPFENTLTVYFNRSMRIDQAFLQASNWIVTPVSEGAAPLSIDAVKAQLGQPDVAHLTYAGGGSTYLLSPLNLFGQDGESFEDGYGSALFEIIFGDEPAPTIRLFDSVYGPLGISQRLRSRRSMDDHVSNRAMALALDEQFRLRIQSRDGTIGRDGKPGKRRT